MAPGQTVVPDRVGADRVGAVPPGQDGELSPHQQPDGDRFEQL
jgi:hypothetical protein